MISPLAYVDKESQIGENVTIHPFAYIDKDVVIGDNNVIMPYSSILRGARIGNNNTFYQGSIISAVPQDFKYNNEDTTVEIGDNNVFREYLKPPPLMEKHQLETETSSCKPPACRTTLTSGTTAL